MHSFSIIIPLLDNPQGFEDTVASVLRHRPTDTQVIVVTDTDYADPHCLESDDVEFVCLDGQSNLIDCFNEGVYESTGEVIGMLRPGVELEEGWHNAISNAFENPSVGTASPIVVSKRRRNKVVTTGVERGTGFTRRLAGNGKSLKSVDARDNDLYNPTSWAGFYRAELLLHLLDEVDSIDHTLDPQYLDLEIGLCMTTMGFGCQLCHDCVVTTSCESEIKRESKMPHGCSAQRAYCRHVLHIGSTNNFVQSTLVKLCEFATSPLASWKLKHARQRSLARRYREQDEVFSDDVSVAARKLRRAEIKPKLRVFHPEEGEDAAAFEEAGRRAATTMASEKRRTAMEQRENASKRRAA